MRARDEMKRCVLALDAQFLIRSGQVRSEPRVQNLEFRAVEFRTNSSERIGPEEGVRKGRRIGEEGGREVGR